MTTLQIAERIEAAQRADALRATIEAAVSPVVICLLIALVLAAMHRDWSHWQ